MTLFDSNFWIAFFNKDDSEHKKAVTIMRDAPALGITEYCVVETTSILTFKSGKGAADLFLEYVADNADVSILYSARTFFDETLRLFGTLESRKLSFTDVSLLLLSTTHDIVTFDTALTKEIRKLKKRI